MYEILSFLLISLSLVSCMPIRSESNQPVINRINRIPQLHGIKALQQQILISAHRESTSRAEQSQGNHYTIGHIPWNLIDDPTKSSIIDNTFHKQFTTKSPTVLPTTDVPTTQIPTTQTPTTQIPTTETPTTPVPTTETPTTQTPTTETPTTQTPTTQTPTTQIPTTETPTTQTPTTESPTTQVPTTETPTTPAPTTPAPTTPAPTTPAPTTPAPTTPAPTTPAPTTPAPTTLAPTTLAPTTLAPTTQTPTTPAPATPYPVLSPDTSAPGSHGIAYNGGYVMTNPVRVYLVYYGSWTSSQSQQTINIINTFVTNLGTSQWWNIQTSYYQPDPNTGVRYYVQNGITLGGNVVIGVDYNNGGTDLTDANVVTIISNQITSGNLPYDADGVYIMISSSEVMETGFCSQDCGWHSAAAVTGTSLLLKHGWVGDATTRCPGACTAFAHMNSPNGNKAADGIISILAHEIAESVSDPYLNAWRQPDYTENADKCAWNFGNTYMTSNNGLANMHIEGLHYLVQSNWKNRDGGGCVLSL